jgi:hypothetical protein
MNIMTYGTLMVPEIMREVSGCVLDSVEVILDKYQRYAVQGEQYPGIISDAEGHVEGVLYLDVPPEAVNRLDVFEGDMYSREPVAVRKKKDGIVMEGMAYVVKAGYVKMLTDEIWDYQNFLQHGKQLFETEYCGFNELKNR